MAWIQLRGRSHRQLGEMLDASRRHQLTYFEVGTSLSDSLPPGYQHVRESISLGAGDAAFASACIAIRQWAAHRHIGATIWPVNAAIVQGETLLVVVAKGQFAMVAPCRIVEVVNTAERIGFAYGTLPGHPEIGEESFIVARAEDGTVSAEIVAFSRPGDAVVRLAGPLARYVQRRATLGYLEGIRRFVDEDQPRRK